VDKEYLDLHLNRTLVEQTNYLFLQVRLQGFYRMKTNMAKCFLFRKSRLLVCLLVTSFCIQHAHYYFAHFKLRVWSHCTSFAY